MVEILAKLYRTILPYKLRYKLLEARKAWHLNAIKKEIIAYYKTVPAANISPEVKEVLAYLEENELQVFPYNFTKKYVPDAVQVQQHQNGFRYVVHNGKKIFYKKSWTDQHIRENYCSLASEQDKQSPHLYLTNTFNLSENTVVADIGAAEGIFALDHIEKIAHLYLFETDHEWIEALEKTFEPWRNKVSIVNKFVSHKNDEKNVTIDAYFGDSIAIDFLKIDVDGAEASLLKGAEHLLKKDRPLQLAICTYHKQNDEIEFTDLLKQNRFNVNPSDGYMLFYYEDFKPPYLRRGLLRATK